jgi:hypothetical protein
MNEIEKLRVLLPHWIEHNGEHAAECRLWAQRAGAAGHTLSEAARLPEQANAQPREGLEQLGGALEQHPE